jgi:hypothetical protein
MKDLERERLLEKRREEQRRAIQAIYAREQNERVNRCVEEYVRMTSCKKA